jgi:hypothetical protein
MTAVPTDSDWGDFQGDFDIAFAYQHFSGKSNAEIQTEFKKNILERCSDIR